MRALRRSSNGKKMGGAVLAQEVHQEKQKNREGNDLKQLVKLLLFLYELFRRNLQFLPEMDCNRIKEYESALLEKHMLRNNQMPCQCLYFRLYFNFNNCI